MTYRLLGPSYIFPSTNATLQWASGVTAPTLSQTTISGSGQTLTIQAQTSSSGTGGNLSLQAGGGTVASGNINLGTSTATALSITPIPTGATTLQFVAGVTSVTINQATTSSASGANWSIAAQSTSFDTGTAGSLTLSGGVSSGTTGSGGDVIISAGGGNTAAGAIRFRRTNSDAIIISPVNATGNTTLSWVSTSTPTINHGTATTATGVPFTIQSQSSTFATGTVTGGNLVLNAGNTSGAATSNTGGAVTLTAGNATNATSNTGGSVNLSVGTGATSDGTINFQRAGSNALVFSPNPTGASSLNFALGVTNASIGQTTALTASASPLTIQSQATVADGYDGGNLKLNAGGTTGVTSGNGGGIVLQSGAAGGGSAGSIVCALGQNTAGASTFFNWQIGPTTVLKYTPSLSSTQNFQFIGNTAVSISQGTSSTANGSSLFLISQSSSFGIGTVTAGNLALTAGSATGTATSNTGGNVVITAGAGSGATTNTGGNISITSGTGATANGIIQLQISGTNRLVIASTGTITVSNLGTGIVHSSSVGLLSSSTIVDADIASNAAIVVSKLAAGTSGQILLNSATPTPTWTSLSADASISSTGVVSVLDITGTAGTVNLASTAANLQWVSAAVTPTITQATSSGAGQDLTIKSQASSASTAGSIILAVGTSSTTNASRIIHFNEGTNSAIRFQINPSATSTMSIQPAVTAFSIQHNSTSAATNASALTIAAQSTTYAGTDGYTGGGLNLNSGSSSGTGTAAGGTVTVNAGSANAASTGTGGNVTLNAGSATAVGGTGGQVRLNAGSGGTTNGSIQFMMGGTTVMSINPINPTGTTSVNYINSVIPSIQQNSIANANGATFTIQAQPVTSDGYTGGTLLLRAGDATGATTGTGGLVILQAGSGLTSTGIIAFRGGTTTAVQFSPINATGSTVLSWLNNTTPTINQTTSTTHDGYSFTLQAQTCARTDTNGVGGTLNLAGGACNGTNTGNTNTGGNVIINAGSATNGTTNVNGVVNIQNAGTTLLSVGSTGMAYSGSSAISLAGGAVTVTLSSTQYRFPYLIFNGTVTGAVTIVFPTTAIAGTTWIVDLTAATGISVTNTVTLKINGNNWGTTVTANTNLYSVTYNGTRLYGTPLTP